jgi:repressor LexA
MDSISALTRRQSQIFNYIQERQQEGETPSLRELASHFGFKSKTAIQDHLHALERKGVLSRKRHSARSLTLLTPLRKIRSRVVDIPIYGSIPAGFAEDRVQEAKGCISVDVQTLGVPFNSRTFALEVKGDSMIGKAILDGDYVILQHGLTPRSGDVVAALIDHESTLKTFVMERGKPYLKAENPRYPKLMPASELMIQGVMQALIRRRK